MAKSDRKPRLVKPKAEQKLLGGMEDSAIPELEKLARHYARIRDERMELNDEEGKLKAKTLTAMKKHGKTLYKRAGVEIRLVESVEDLKVKIKRGDEDQVEVEVG